MRIISYFDQGVPSLGVMTSDTTYAEVHDLDRKLPHTLDALLRLPDGLAKLRTAAKGAVGKHPLSAVKYAPLLEQPHGFWALALNFKTHILETGLTTSEVHPQIFLRVPKSFVPPNAAAHRAAARPCTRVRLRSRTRRCRWGAAAGTSRSSARSSTSPATAPSTKARCGSSNATTASSVWARTSIPRARTVPG